MADVGDVTLPFTPPEAMGVAKGMKVPLKASMGVCSMGVVVIQATSRMSSLPTDHEASVNMIDQHLFRDFVGGTSSMRSPLSHHGPYTHVYR